MNKISRSLIQWYDKNAYDFPWRKTTDVYKIWISEIMLQQTQVTTVVDYYNRWLKNFPNVEILANANIHDVLKAWEGLGYYQRAHNIYNAAQTIMYDYKGQFPTDYNVLLNLSGIGDYTASAIMSIAYYKPYPAIDSNLKRVILRLAGIDDIKNIVDESKIFVKSLMNNYNASKINQSLMDLGREVCLPKKPLCSLCPVEKFCYAKNEDEIIKYSIVSKSVKKPIYDVAVGMIWNKNKILISKRKDKGLLGGLWELPGGKKEKSESFTACLKRELYEELNIKVDVDKTIGNIKHNYSHFGINMRGFHCYVLSGSPKAISAQKIKWIDLEHIKDYPFPKATLKLFEKAGCYSG